MTALQIIRNKSTIDQRGTHKYAEFFQDNLSHSSSSCSLNSQKRESIHEELNNAFVTGIMHPLNYVKHENREVIIKPVKKRPQNDNEEFVSCLNKVEHLKGTAEHGILMDPLKLKEYGKQH